MSISFDVVLQWQFYICVHGRSFKHLVVNGNYLVMVRLQKYLSGFYEKTLVKWKIKDIYNLLNSEVMFTFSFTQDANIL